MIAVLNVYELSDHICAPATGTELISCFAAVLSCPAGVALPASRAVTRRHVALLVRATAAPARPATPATAEVDTSLTPKQLGLTMPGAYC